VANFIAIDLDSQGLYAVAGGTRGAAKVTHALAWTADDGEAPPNLTAETAKAIGEKLREKLRTAGIAQVPVLVSVGRDRVILKELKYPAVPPTEEPALVRFQAIKEMSESPDDVVLDYAPLGEAGAAGGERRSMAVVVRRELFAAIQAVCQAANLKLAGVTPRPYAVAAGLVRALSSGAVLPPEDKTGAVAALTLSAAGGEFTVVRRGEVTYTLAIPAPVVASETMLVAQVRRNLAVYAGQHPGHPIQAVYLAEVDGDWAERLGSALNVPVHAYDPLAGSAQGVPVPLRGRFAGAAGLLAGKAADALPINFAAPRQPVFTKDPAKRRLMTAGVLGLLLLFGAGAFGYLQVSDGDARIAALEQRKANLKEQIDKGAPDANRVKAIDGWAKREVVWLEELYDLADRMPADDGVRVISFTGTPMPLDKNGKQEAQAQLSLKLAAVNTDATTNLMSAFERDNAGAVKYYVGTQKFTGGLIQTAGGSRHNQAFTLSTKVNHREAAQYTRNTPFVPPKRTTGYAGSAAARPDPAPEVALETAPPPSEPMDEPPE
jgi:Tfp pilus assembly PilM family ATPase